MHIEPLYDSFLLIKIFEESEFRDAFMNGLIYMNNIGYFNELEKNNQSKTSQNDAARADRADGVNYFLRTTGDTHWVFEPNDKGEWLYMERPGLPNDNRYLIQAKIGRQDNAEKKLFCMYTLWGDSVNKKFLKVDDDIKNFGEYAVLIYNTPLFVERIKEKAKQLNLKQGFLKFGFVDYIDENATTSVTQMGVFRKFKRFQYQNEFRICLEKEDVEGPYKDLRVETSDICAPFFTNDLIKANAMGIDGLTFGQIS